MRAGRVCQRFGCSVPPASLNCNVPHKHAPMKTRLMIWLSIELAVASILSASVCILRRGETQAYFAWRDNPTAATRAELDRERATTLRVHVHLGAVLWASMAAVTVPLMVSRARRKSGPSDVTKTEIKVG
jgi:hypothetical protein